MDTETQTRRGWTPCEVRMEAETGDTVPECQELRATADGRDGGQDFVVQRSKGA